MTNTLQLSVIGGLKSTCPFWNCSSLPANADSRHTKVEWMVFSGRKAICEDLAEQPFPF